MSDPKQIDVVTYAYDPRKVALNVWGELNAEAVAQLNIEGVESLRLIDDVAEVMCTLQEGVEWKSVKIKVLNQLCNLLRWKADDVAITETDL